MNKYIYFFFGVIVTIVLISCADFIYLSIIGRQTCIEGCSENYRQFSNWLACLLIFIGGTLGYLIKIKKVTWVFALIISIFLLITWLVRTWYGLDYGYGLNLSY